MAIEIWKILLQYKQISLFRAVSLQSCSTLCDPMDCSLPGSSVHGILQARMLKWVFIPFSRGSSRPKDGTHVSYISCTGRWVLNTTSTTWEAQGLSVGTRKSILRATRSTKKFPIGFVMWIPSHKSLKTPHRLLTLVVYFGIKSVSGDPLILTISIFYRVTSYLVTANL